LLQVGELTGVPILLPDTLPLRRVHTQTSADANGYRTEFYADPGCYSTACYYGAIEASRNGQFPSSPFSEPNYQNSNNPQETFVDVELADQSSAVFINTLGPYNLGWLRWEFEGVSYLAVIKNGDVEDLVELANSAIAGGDRSISTSDEAICASALEDARNRIEENREIRVGINALDMSTWDSSGNYPPGRPMDYSFNLDGRAMYDIMNSPQFLNSISTDIINNCTSASAVSFVGGQSDWIITFGLFDEGQVEQFRCVSPRENDSGELPWGYMYCL
jgi:hypothetical protein